MNSKRTTRRTSPVVTLATVAAGFPLADALLHYGVEIGADVDLEYGITTRTIAFDGSIFAMSIAHAGSRIIDITRIPRHDVREQVAA